MMPTGKLGPALYIFLIALVSACASVDRTVDRRMVLPQSAATHELKEDQFFLMAVPIQTPDPEFPQNESGPGRARLTRICVNFHVTTDGRVENAVIVSDPLECPDSAAGQTAAFASAVTETVSRWSYFGAAICTTPGGRDVDEDCESPEATLEPVSIQLMYVFVFEQTEGRRSVTSRRN